MCLLPSYSPKQRACDPYSTERGESIPVPTPLPANFNTTGHLRPLSAMKACTVAALALLCGSAVLASAQPACKVGHGKRPHLDGSLGTWDCTLASACSAAATRSQQSPKRPLARHCRACWKAGDQRQPAAPNAASSTRGRRALNSHPPPPGKQPPLFADLQDLPARQWLQQDRGA